MQKEKPDHYLNKIHQIDKILSPAVESLIEFATKKAPMDEPLIRTAKAPIFFPPWVSDHAVAPVKHYLLTRATCSSTLLRVWRVRRRFPQFATSLEKLGDVKNIIENTFVPKDRQNYDHCIEHLKSESFGGLNPVTASAIFSILVDAGERFAHSGLGLLACFAMLWSLHRKFPDKHASGAQMDPWGPSAFITAKCLLPFHSLRKLSLYRAKSIEQTMQILSKLIELCGKYNNPDPYTRWEFTSCLGDLSSALSAASKVAIYPQALKQCSEAICKLSDQWNGLDPQGTLAEVINKLDAALTVLIKERVAIAKETKKNVGWN